MTSAKRFLSVVLAFALAIIIFALTTPRVGHALVAALVQVSNTMANPVPTVRADNPARSAVVLKAEVDFGPADTYGTATFSDANGSYNVPLNKQLVIDSVSGFVTLPGSELPTSFEISAALSLQGFSNGPLNFYDFAPVITDPDSAINQLSIHHYAVAQDFTIYAGTFTSLGFRCTRDASNGVAGSCTATMYGHLE